MRPAKSSQELIETALYWELLADRAGNADLADEMRWIAENYVDLACRALARERAAAEAAADRIDAA
jgi:hypothetical protein